MLRKWDLVFARTGATVGKSFLIRDDLPNSVFASYLIRVRSSETDMANYLSRFFDSHDYWQQITGFSSGIGQPNVNGSKLKSLRIPLAPLIEQKRIADKLDTVLAPVDACRERLSRVSLILKRFRQSVLAVATSGKLTADWRIENLPIESGKEIIQKDALSKQRLLSDDPALANKKSSDNSEIALDYAFEIPNTWAFTTWGKISEWITYGFTRPMPSSPIEKKLVTAKDVLNFKLSIEEAGFTSAAAFNDLSDKDRPLRGDLLITKDGTIGRAALVQTDEPFCINQSVAVCWLRSTEMNKNFLEFVANTEFTQKFVKDKIRGVAIQHLSIIDFAQCPVPVPPSEEQHEIVRRVESLFAFADRLEARLAIARTAIDRLTPALLAKAFRGELVPQDPSDEPASVLLARISAIPVTKTKKPKASAAKQRPKDQVIKEKKNMAKSRQDVEVKHQPYLAEQLRQLGGSANVEALFKASDLPITDFYKQLAWEVGNDHIRDGKSILEVAK